MRGLSTVTAATILTIITLVAMVGVFGFYSSYFSGVSANVSQQTYLISLSKMISFQVSQMTFYGIQPALESFNVSYLIWVSAPLKNVTVVIFNTTELPLSSLYYYSPAAENTYYTDLFTNSKSGLGYSQVNYFELNGSIYLPQGSQLLATLKGVRAFNISTNTTYILSAKIPANNIIVIWILYNYLGKWYRLDYTYINPASNALGVYVVSGGTYNLSYSLPIPQNSAQKGTSIGFWFEDLNNQTNGTILTYEYQPVSQSGGSSKSFTVAINQTIVNGRAELSISILGSNIQPVYVPNLYLNQGSWYFVTIDGGSGFGSGYAKHFYIEVYEPGSLTPITNTTVPTPQGTTNGYVAVIQFGGQPGKIAAISQAYYASIHDSNAITTVNGIPQVAGVFQDVFGNGFYYNNTENLNNVFNQDNLNLLVYWDFSFATSPAPTSVLGLAWILNPGKTVTQQLVYPQ